jgi:nucleoside-diphosphate-sugar epimerase
MTSLIGRRVLVTGASGFVGWHLVQRLQGLGACVGAVSRDVEKISVVEAHERMIFDLREEEETKRAIADFRPEVVFHLAAHPDGAESTAQASAAIQWNASMTLNLLEACRLAQTRLVIYADSCKVYGNSQVPYTASLPPQPLCSYAIGKLAGWELCRLYQRLYEIDVVSIRSTIIYGPRQGNNLIRSITDRLLAGETEIHLMGGTQTRDPLYIDDAIDAFLMAAERGNMLSGEVINIGGGCEQTVYSLALQIVEAHGAQATVKVAPNQLRPNDTLRSYCDNVEATDRLGWSPKTSFAHGLDRTLAAMRIQEQFVEPKLSVRQP